MKPYRSTFYLLLVLAMVLQVKSYLQIEVITRRLQNQITYCIPLQVQQYHYCLDLSLNNNKQFILSPLAKQLSLDKKHKQQKLKQLKNKEIIGKIFVSNIQNWRQDNWKGTLKQAIKLYQGRFNYKISLNFTNIKQIIKDQKENDGLISFGPNYQNNRIYKLLKNSSQYINNDIISFYRGDSSYNLRIQIGGFQHLYTKLSQQNIRFYQLNLVTQQDKWKIPIQSISCMIKTKHDDNPHIYNIPNTKLNITINISSEIIKLPKSISFDIERGFQTNSIGCRILQTQFLACINFTNKNNKAQHYLQFQLSQNSILNISLHDLQFSYNSTSKQTIFKIQFVQNSNQVQISEVILKYYYMSIDLKQKKMIYSQINLDNEYHIAKYLIFFGVSILIGGIVIAIGMWNMCKPQKGYKRISHWIK